MAAGLVLGNQTEMTAQALAEFVSPGLSVKSSLMTGFVYLHYSDKFSRTMTSTFDTTTTNYHEITNIYEIPLILRYKFLDKAIQPYVYAGTGLAIKQEKGYLIENPEQLQHQDFGITLILGAGIDARITKNLFIKAEWRYDLLAHLPYIGIVYRM